MSMKKRNFEVYCINGHQSDKVCSLRSCAHPAAICRQKSCSEFGAHSQCHHQTDTKTVIDMFNRKITQPKYKAIDQILQRIALMIRQMKSLINEIMNEMGQSQYLFEEVNKRELQLFQSAMNGRLKPQIVSDCIKEDNSEYIKLGREIRQKMREVLSKISNQRMSIQSTIRDLWDKNPCYHFRFQDSFSNRQVCNILKQGKIAKIVSQKGTGSLNLTLPFLKDNQKIKFKILKKSHVIFIGVFVITKLETTNFSKFDFQKDAYCIGNGGKIMNSRDRNQHNKNCQLIFKEGDEIQVVWQRENSKIQIKNCKSGVGYSFKNVSVQDKEVGFGVFLRGKDDSVQIIK